MSFYTREELDLAAHVDCSVAVIEERRDRSVLPMEYDFDAVSAFEDDDEEARFESELRDRARRGKSFIPIEEVALPTNGRWEREKLPEMPEKLRKMVEEKGRERVTVFRAQLRHEYREYQAERDTKGSGARRERNGMPMGRSVTRRRSSTTVSGR